MFRAIKNFFNEKIPLDEKEKHLKSEGYFQKYVKLSYENALNLLVNSFFNKEENCDLVGKILGNNDISSFREVINIALDKKEGNLFVHINNLHTIDSDQPKGIVYKSHIEGNEAIWEIFCDVIYQVDRYTRPEYRNVPELNMSPYGLPQKRFSSCINDESISIEEISFNFFENSWESNYRNFFSIEKFKSLRKKICILSTSNAVCMASPLFTLINMEHVRERMHSQSIKGAHKHADL